MKNLNKLIRILQSYYCLGLYFGILQAQVVITEFFINSAEGTQIPQYIELYNTSSSDTSLAGWSIQTKDQNDVHSGIPSEFIEGNFVDINEININPKGYFLISSCFFGSAKLIPE